VDSIHLAQDTDQWLRMGVCGLDSSDSGHGSVVVYYDYDNEI